ncbi:IS200/IS605 family transposase [Micromonospora fluostatini]|uniref:IS200/IS605 family transposase n=1 Tax=Micromonospora fluostatini TaxID=1629071 RepID=A0ABY2DJT8_9ACTN|nr:IS200/IS605 family transposase [Micromonospora fluostatini]
MSPRWTHDPDIRRGRSTVINLQAHLVFVTKYRRGVFDDAMLTRCEQVMRNVCADFDTELREFNGEDDHVHLLVHYPPTVALSRLVNSLKGVSSRRLRQEFTDRTDQAFLHGRLWSPSYFAASCEGAPVSTVRQYIEQQKRPG